MVAIEYSPNGRASCQGCRSKIVTGEVRVSVKSKSPYQRYQFINQYYHAGCYGNRTDFTKFYGFAQLDAEDQKKYLTEDQKRRMFPEDYMGNADELVASAKKASEDVGAKRKESPGDGVQEGAEKKKKAKTQNAIPITITGLKYASVHAVPGQKLKLIREPDNPYDANAIRVDNTSDQKIGHVKKEQAAKLSTILKKCEGKLVFETTVLTSGDGYSQSARVTYTSAKCTPSNAAAVPASTSDSEAAQTKQTVSVSQAEPAQNPPSEKKPTVTPSPTAVYQMQS